MTTTTIDTVHDDTADATRSQRFFARWYPGAMAQVEEAGQAEIRQAQLATATGRTLEIGAGNGLSVPHYTDRVSELTLLEPNPVLRAMLAETAKQAQAKKVSVVGGDAHALDFPDATFDTVTASLVFCSVTDPERALAEVHRVLKPGGRFLFHEHVRGRGVRAFFQDLLTPLQRRMLDGCHANRRFEDTLAASPFELDSLVHTAMPTIIPTIVPMVVGSARRAD